MTAGDRPEAGSLTEEQRERYVRNIDLVGMGEAGQRRLLASSVIVIGAGGLGSAALPYLAAAGVGRIAVVDGDAVELKNMQRQVLHTELGRNKAQSGAERLKALNPDVAVEVLPEYLTPERARELFGAYDLVLDCTDTFGAKFMLSDAAEAVGARLVWASAVGMQGQCSVFGVPDAHGDRLYLRDLIAEEPADGLYPKATDIGVLGAMVGQIGSLQATEAIKLLAGIGSPLVGRVALLDAVRSRWSELPLRKAVVELVEPQC
ncbi:adenylyltransferase and sulfurtransferase [Tessaracoccus bendigoensis DSM 12906]|uniref:Adenylyltransferase and sulfurtransferase n=1 Tax=Tessaracoccus bendigoensis DSM 12906 TaxID=1123357 RepID=A0A1M6IJA4_9ACTN|nr:HesA/MoeB/ThiF family protein [Tessaracoccus bendigoensis]SHJ34552.1 adenylyltransferase and sulfurtransferase [Tessaracoccus bendigoensis DSM 12906]